MKVTDMRTGSVLETKSGFVTEQWKKNPERYVPYTEKPIGEKTSGPTASATGPASGPPVADDEKGTPAGLPAKTPPRNRSAKQANDERPTTDIP